MAVKASAHITLSFVVDVEAYYRYYLLQASTLAKPSKPTTNPPSDSWTDSEPTYTAGSTNSLYFVDLTVFSDGTWSYSEVSLSSSYEAAKEAYNKAVAAQNSVNTLTTRVTNAETAIESNTEQIELRATKTEVTTIVTEAIDDIEVGGRNLLCTSTSFEIRGMATGITVEITEEGYLRIIAESENDNWASVRIGSNYDQVENELSEGDEFVISFSMRSSDATVLPTIYIKTDMGYYNMIGSLSSEWSTVYYAGTWKDANDIAFHFGFSNCVGTYEIRSCKIEKGNKATDWTPAPEDIETELETNYYTKTVTDAQIQVASNAVTISVGETISSVETSLTEDINDTNSALDVVRGDVLDLQDEQSAQANTIGDITSRVTNVETLANGFNIRIETAERNFASIDGNIQAEVEARETLIRAYDDGDFQGVEIGVSDSPFVTRLSNEELGFYEDGTKVAYIGNKKMYITDAEVETSLRIGNFVFKPHGDGNLGLIYIEDE